MSYCTLTEFKGYQAVVGTGDDALITRLIDAATTIIERATGTQFGVETAEAHVLDAAEAVDGRALWLDGWCAGVTEVVNGDGQAVASDQYVTDPRNAGPYFRLALRPGATVGWAGDEITVTGYWGYATDVPNDIRHVCLRLAAWLYRQKDNSNDMDRAVAISVNATLLPARLPRDIEEMLRPYRWLAG